ncbi:hypothetical protein FDC50_15010 [Clostridium botulinum]|nr:hypothetical protein KU41_15380 [Clostridium botulinum]MBY6802813.1 hypothetical protein [Clostridium botulinum]MBY6812932.1 hypothetical protein [Clostridium botulinum]MBY6818941.1 hypothetical protein [Clostridium botulinum]NFJ49561.1 hypothetical protein [Clostridium botulinum]
MSINEYKVNWMLKNGFKRRICPVRKVLVYCYKGYEWTFEEIKNTSTSVIVKYKLFYDGQITEEKLNKYIEFEKTFREKGVNAAKCLLQGFIKC